MVDEKNPGQNPDVKEDISSFEELSLDGKGFEALADSEDHTLIEGGAGQHEDIVQNASVQSTGRETFETTLAAVRETGDPVVDTPQVERVDNQVDRVDGNVGVGFENVNPAFAEDDDDAEEEDAQTAETADESAQDFEQEVETVEAPLGLPDEDPVQGAPAIEAETPTPTPPEDPETPAPFDDPDFFADPRELTIDIQNGVEDNRLSLDLELTGANLDGGTETVTISIANVPEGFSFENSAGDKIGTLSGGIWTFTEDEIEDLFAVPTEHYSGTNDWTFTVLVEELSGSTFTKDFTTSVHFEAVADAPDLSAENVAGMENTWIDMDVSTALVDADGSESVSVFITDIPNGVTFNAGTVLTAPVTLADGTVINAGSVVLDSKDLDDLKVRQADNVSDDFDLRIFSQTTEDQNGDRAVSGPANVHVDVGIVDPSASGSGAGNEDSWIKLDLNANVNNSDGTENLTVFLEDLPNDVEIRFIDSGNAVIPVNGQFDVTGNLDNIEIRRNPATGEHSDEDISLNIRAIAKDVDAGGVHDTPLGDAVAPDTSETVSAVNVVVKAVADEASISGQAVGVEDKFFDLDINVSLTDTDGSESITAIIVSGVPEGAILNQGTELLDGNGQHTGRWSLTENDLNGLQIKPPLDSNTDFQLNVAVTTEEAATGDQVAVKTVTSDRNINVRVFGDADLPTVDVVPDTQTINEDTMYNLRAPIGNGFAVDGDLSEQGSGNQTTSSDGSETLTFRITPQEAGTRLAISDDANISSGEFIDLPPEGFWTVSAQDVFAGKVFVGGAENWSSADGTDTIHFDIQSISTENDANQNDSALNGSGLTRDGQAISESQVLTLEINPEIDGVRFTASATGVEDSANGIAYAPVIRLIDDDGSETLTGTVKLTTSDSDMLAGHLELNGTRLTPVDNGDGTHSWEIPVSNLAATGTDGEFRLTGVSFFPEEHNADDIALTISVTTMETRSGETNTVTGNSTITVKAVADAPVVDVSRADQDGLITGVEDTFVQLGLDAQLVDADGSEVIHSLRLFDVPSDWEVGYLNAQGEFTRAAKNQQFWQLDEGRLDEVVMKPPADAHNTDAINVRFSAITRETEGNNQVQTRFATSTESFSIKVVADADIPSVITQDAEGFEDTKIELDIRPALGTDTDGSESLSVIMGDIPDGAAFFDSSDNPVGQRVNIGPDGAITPDANGTHWLFTNNEWQDLFVQPPLDSNEDFVIDLRVRATEDSNGDFEEVTSTINVDVIGVADTPNVAVGAVTINGDEDVAINPNFSQFASGDSDGSESLSIVISDVPAGLKVFMTAGNEDALKYIGNGKWSVDAEHIDAVRVSTPKDFAGSKDMTVKFISTENDGDVSSLSRTVRFTVKAEADAPTAAISAAVIEDTNGINLSISAKPSDLTAESAETITEIRINIDDSDLPPGTQLQLTYDGQTHNVVSGGDDLVIQVDANTLGFDPATGQLQGVVLEGVPAHWAKDIPVNLTVEATDIDGSTAETAVSGTVKITADADPLSVFEVNPAISGDAETSLSMGLNVAYTDTDGSEEAYFIIENVPNGVTLSQGFSAGNNVWIVPGDGDLSTLSITSDFGGTATLQIRAVVEDTDPDGGLDRHIMDPISQDITFNDVGNGSGPGAPDPATPDVASAITANEDQQFDLSDITMTVNQAGGTPSAIVISDLPAGASVSGGFFNPVSNSFVIPYDQRDEVTITPPADFSGELQVDITVVSINANGVTSSSTSDDFVLVDLAPVTDGGTFSGGIAAGQTAAEDGGLIPLEISLSQLDDDFSESMTTNQVTISNLPAGSSLFLNGTELTPNAQGAFVIDVDSIDGVSSIDINGLSVRPPEHFDGDLSFRIETEFQDQTGASKTVGNTLTVDVDAVADGAQLTAENVTGTEDTAIALDLTALNPDVSGQYASEQLSVVIANVPDGAFIFGASNNADGTWTVKSSNINLETGEISNVSILPPRNFSGSMNLELKTFSVERSNEHTVENSQTFTVDVGGVADRTDLDIASTTGSEDAEVALNINASLSDDSETLLVTISDVPENARFTDGSGNAIGVEVQVDGTGKPVLDANNQPVPVAAGSSSGAWIFSAAQIATVHFVGPANADGAFELKAVSTAIDGDNVTHGLLEDFTITLEGVADPVTLTINDNSGNQDAFQAAGNEDQANGIALDIDASLTDTDGSESLQLVITDAPAGSVFVSGSNTIEADANGQWVIEGHLIDNLRVVPPENFNGSFRLQVEAQSHENGTSQSQTATLDVNVAAVNDAPVLTLDVQNQALAGQVDEPITVIPDAADGGLQLGISDVDGSRLNGLTIKIQDGAQLGDTLGLHGIEIGLGQNGELVVQGTDITVSYDQATKSLAFQGEADASVYADLAEKVVLTNASGNLDGGDRVVKITAFDEEGHAGSLTTTTSIDDVGATLSNDALADVTWSNNGVTMTGGTGDDQFVLHLGDANSLNGGQGDDTLFLRGSAGQDGDWLFNVQDDGTATITSASDPQLSGLVSLDHGSINSQQSTDTQLVLDQDSSGRIDLDNGETIEFTDLDQIIV